MLHRIGVISAATKVFGESCIGIRHFDCIGLVNWAVSQGAQLRRVHVKGNLALHDYGGWSSGGFMADSLVDGQLISGSQQQFITRNNQQNWTGGVWNMVFVGNMTAPAALNRAAVAGSGRGR